MLILVVIVLGFTLYMYSVKCLQAPITDSYRYGLAVCRVVFLLFLLYLLTLPQIQEILKTTTYPTLYVVLDDSLSMAYPTAPPAMDRTPDKSRWDVTLETLAHDIIPVWTKKRFNLQYGLLSKITLNTTDPSAPWSSDIPASASPAFYKTDLSAAIQNFAATLPPQEPSYLLLFSDGRWNQGQDPISTATLLNSVKRTISPSIYTFGIGPAVSMQDIIVDHLQLPAVARSGQPLQIQAHIIARGVEPEAQVRIRMLGENRQGDQVIEQDQQVSFSNESEDTTLAFDIPSLPPGPYMFTVEAEPLSGEWITSNNMQRKGIQIRAAKDALFLITSGPDWEFKFLKRTLENQKSLHVSAYLQHENGLSVLGDRSWVEKHGSGQAAAQPGDVPIHKTLEQLQQDLDRCRVLILHNFALSADQRSFFEHLKKYVENGGGLLWIPGPNNSNTPPKIVRDLVPAPIARSFSEQEKAAFVRITQDSPSPFQSFLQEYPHVELPPLSQYVLSRPHLESGKILLQGEAAPNERVDLVTLFRYGLGRIVIVGSRSFWQWNMLTGKDILTSFWLNTLNQCNPRLETLSGKIQTRGFLFTVFDTVHLTYRPGDIVSNATEARGVSIAIQGPQRRDVLWMSPSNESPGVFESSYTPVEVGTYQVATLSQDASTEFRVERASLELRDLRQNIGGLRKLAQLTGGDYANQPAWKTLANNIPVQTQVTHEERIRFAGEKWWVAVLLIFFLGLEWFLRWLKGLP